MSIKFKNDRDFTSKSGESKSGCLAKREQMAEPEMSDKRGFRGPPPRIFFKLEALDAFLRVPEINN